MRLRILETGHYPIWASIGDPHSTTVLRQGAVVQFISIAPDQDGYDPDRNDMITKAANGKFVIVNKSQSEEIPE
jgi:hypothetical protein